MNLLNRGFDFVSLSVERGCVFAEQFDFDWLGIAFQIADDVGNDANEFDLQGGFGFSNLIAQIRNHCFSSPLVSGFQLDRIVAPIRLSHKQSHLETGASRIAFNLRRLHQLFFDVLQDAVGFRQ